MNSHSPIAAAARLDLPPSAAARIAPPPGFGRRFVLFGDAEEEFDWRAPFSRDATATTAIATLPGATRRFNAAGVIPTYLADFPVVATPESAATLAVLAGDGQCEIGAQLHPWVTPPFEEEVNRINSFTGNLPVALQRAKLAALTGQIERSTQVRPRIYRAGRYGIGADTAALLAEAGYRLDVSVRARFDYSTERGPDFSGHPLWPWRVSERLAALPLTAGWSGPLARWPMLARAPFARRGVWRTPLTPEGVAVDQALQAIRALLDSDLAIFSLSFHTPSLVPGHTPYVRDKADLKTFWAWWEAVFALFAKAGVKPARGSEIVAVLHGEVA